MNYFFALLGAAFAAESLFHLPLKASIDNVMQAVSKSSRVIRSKHISEHWKEKVVLQYAIQSFKGSTLLLIVLIGFAAAFLLGAGGGFYFGDEFAKFLVLPTGLIVVTGFSIVYVAIRRKLTSTGEDGDYSFMDRLLHRIALGNNFVPEASFDFELSSTKPNVDNVVKQKHVFVSGLARAGTTVLMRRFHATGSFRSLTYREMPFVLMPNLWQKLSGSSKKQSQKQERAHGDGLLVDVDSPEALEEVFWRVFAGDKYIHKNCLTPMQTDSETVDRFRKYVATILASTDGKQTQYLSKNNNNVLRISSLKTALPESIIVVPFRKPLQQADSLLSQHTHFCDDQKADPFISSYMGWLVHHEFGLDHRPFAFTDEAARYTDSNTLNHWLEIWLNTYTHIRDQAADQVVLLSYETLCSQLPTVWNQLREMADLPEELQDADPISLRTRKITGDVDSDLLSKADSLYDDLCAMQLKATN